MEKTDVSSAYRRLRKYKYQDTEARFENSKRS